MNNTQPMFDPATHYRIEVQSRVDVEWLQSFASSVEISAREAGQTTDNTVLYVYTDQSGIVGLVRKLHGLGITIRQIQVVSEAGKGAEIAEQR